VEAIVESGQTSSVSPQHCEIHVNGPEGIVRDLGSRNGTLVN
jgi:pSer/pThr/pTyr-binding forkhead associated (FHA) protein